MNVCVCVRACVGACVCAFQHACVRACLHASVPACARACVDESVYVCNYVPYTDYVHSDLVPTGVMSSLVDVS